MLKEELAISSMGSLVAKRNQKMTRLRKKRTMRTRTTL